MKNYLLIIFSLFMLCNTGISQEPSTTWPYIFKDFTTATVYLTNGGKIEYTANIHLAQSTLHYIDGENIKEASSKEILLVEIDSRKFMKVNGSLMEVVKDTNGGFVAMLKEPDYSQLNETGGAYGGPSNTLSTKALSSIEGIGSITTHMQQVANKENGKPLPLKTSYYIVANGSIYPAQKSTFADLLPIDKKEGFKAFLKSNKIKWGNPDDLIKLVDYINGE